MAHSKPFLKWAGGKTQLLPEITAYLPLEMRFGRIIRYVEPFIGSGAVFFHVASMFPVSEAVIVDRNEEVIVAFTVVKDSVHLLIEVLTDIENKYHALPDGQQADYFYSLRATFNATKSDFDFVHFSDEWVQRAAWMIFLNRTCFNGLFRVNAKGEFNTPFGKYSNPTICDRKRLVDCSRLLQKAIILRDDFTTCETYADENTFVYFDPPYRPLSKTANFTAYSKENFGDADQRRLAALYRRLDVRGTKVMLSNSDPQNVDPNDDFFETLYSGYRLVRVRAARSINSNAAKRGEVNELLIMNYRD